MGRVDRYRSIVIDIIKEYASYFPSNGRIDGLAVIDTERDHYLVISDGWDGQRREHGCVIHIDIRDGQVWVQHDATNRPVATELIEAGVPPSDIVLGFHPEHLRQYTEFSTGSTPVSRTAEATDPGPSVPVRGR